MARQFLKPGITGWAQVNGFRGETRNTELMAKRVEHDIWYMENWSWWLDIRIIFMTIINVFRGEENAFYHRNALCSQRAADGALAFI